MGERKERKDSSQLLSQTVTDLRPTLFGKRVRINTLNRTLPSRSIQDIESKRIRRREKGSSLHNFQISKTDSKEPNRLSIWENEAEKGY
jgi:hypothetical protein